MNSSQVRITLSSQQIEDLVKFRKERKEAPFFDVKVDYSNGIGPVVKVKDGRDPDEYSCWSDITDYSTW